SACRRDGRGTRRGLASLPVFRQSVLPVRPLLGAILVFACATVAAPALLGSSSSASGPPFTPERAPALQLAPRLTAADRAWIASVVASVRPEARRLLVAVSGQVEVQL